MVDADDPAVDRLLDGAVDTHMHTAPDAAERRDSDFAAARKARDNGMRGIAIKTHHFETAARAGMATAETGFDVVGGVTLNEWVGGMNTMAVDGAAAHDATIVWLPTITAAHHLSAGEFPSHLATSAPTGESPGVSLVDDEGELTDDTLAVVDRIAAHDLVPGTSHVSPAEAIAFVEAAADRGVSECLVQHPHMGFLDYSHRQMREITELGATLELHWACTTPMLDECASVEDFVAAVEAVGPENVVMATDGGATGNPPAMEMFRQFIAAMLDAGVTEADVETMVRDNPRRILDLD